MNQNNHLNYCRQLLLQFKSFVTVPSLDQAKRATCLHVIDLCRASKKFLLPDGGRLFVDNELRAIDETICLRLPHQFIAIEFNQPMSASSETNFYRRVLFAREDEGGIYITSAAFMQEVGVWAVLGDCFIPSTGYIDRSDPREHKFKIEWHPDIPRDVAGQDAFIVLSLLNALMCSNVHVERREPTKAANKAKAALPFDAYHVLTIDVARQPGSSSEPVGASHRSPREHLRRGHIVRPEGTRPYWRSATIVNAGRGFGRVEKDYRVRNSRIYRTNPKSSTPKMSPPEETSLCSPTGDTFAQNEATFRQL